MAEAAAESSQEPLRNMHLKLINNFCLGIKTITESGLEQTQKAASVSELACKILTSYETLKTVDPRHFSEQLDAEREIEKFSAALKRKANAVLHCFGCGTRETPEWRKGPFGPRTLCNACGLTYAKHLKKTRGRNQAASPGEGGKEGGEPLRPQVKNDSATSALPPPKRARLEEEVPKEGSETDGSSSSPITSLPPPRSHPGLGDKKKTSVSFLLN